jgi:aspartokinase-like uncharacterized kinase
MPSTMVLSEISIPQNWDITSDSLAAWLAARLEASVLVLVKSIPCAAPLPAPEELSRRGWVDGAFPHFLAAGTPLRWFGPGQTGQLRQFLLGDERSSAD